MFIEAGDGGGRKAVDPTFIMPDAGDVRLRAQSVTTPQRLDLAALNIVRAVAIAAGGSHSMMVCDKADAPLRPVTPPTKSKRPPGAAKAKPAEPVRTTRCLFAWGNNSHGQLGVGDRASRCAPRWAARRAGPRAALGRAPPRQRRA